MKTPMLAALLVSALALAACESPGYGPKTTAGTLLGAAAGGLAGAQFGKGSGKLAATAAGTLIGAFAGHSIGRSLDRADQIYAYQAQQAALESAPTGGQIQWHNPESGNSGVVTPTRTYQSASGRYCREYQHTVTVGGQPQDAYGTACRQPDGSWQIVN